MPHRMICGSFTCFYWSCWQWLNRSADSTLINGLGRWSGSSTPGPLAVIRAHPGKRHRYRLISASCDPSWVYSFKYSTILGNFWPLFQLWFLHRWSQYDNHWSWRCWSSAIHRAKTHDLCMYVILIRVIFPAHSISLSSTVLVHRKLSLLHPLNDWLKRWNCQLQANQPVGNYCTREILHHVYSNTLIYFRRDPCTSFSWRRNLQRWNKLRHSSVRWCTKCGTEYYCTG